MLFNIGFKEALKFDQYECFIFHDVDLIPEDDRNEYSCPTSPRHLSVAVDKFNYRQVLDQMISSLNKKNSSEHHFAHFESILNFKVINGVKSLKESESEYECFSFLLILLTTL